MVYIGVMSFTRLLKLRFSQTPLLQQLPEEDLVKIEKITEIKRFPRGSRLIFEGSKPPYMMLILSGSVNIVRNNANGTETLLRQQYPPLMFGYCLLSNQSYSADVVAGETVIAALFPMKAFKDIILDNPESLLTVIAHLSGLIDSLSSEKIELKTSSLADRILRILGELSDSRGICEITHEELGQMAGGSRANISRCLKDFEHKGIIKLGRRKIVLVNR